MKFVTGHNRVEKRIDSDALGHFRIGGEYCRLIPLTQGQFAIVSEEDYERLKKFRWNAHWTETSRSYYAIRTERLSGGKKRMVWMHREILGLSSEDERCGDHVDAGNCLDNRRANLRIGTIANNAMNRRARRGTKSGLKGVSWRSREQSFEASIRVDGKVIRLGNFKTATEAHAAYCEAAPKYFGEFARFE